MSFMTEAHWCGHSKSLGEVGVTQFIIGLVSPDQREYMTMYLILFVAQSNLRVVLQSSS